jgi:hypothetical protein
MREFFPEQRLLELAAAVAAVAPAVAVAVTRPRAQGGMNFSYVAGDEAGSLIGSSELVPSWLSRVSGQAQPAVWWCPIPRIPDSRLWVVSRSGQSLSAAQRARLVWVASELDGLDEQATQLARRAEILENRIASLELLDELRKTPADSAALDEVIGRISELTRNVLPHEAIQLAVYLPGGTHARRYVSRGFDAGALPELVEVPESIRGGDWDYQIVDDLSVTPTGGTNAMFEVGLQSALRLAVRLDGPIVGALSFLSAQPGGFRHDQVSTGRQIAERVAMGLWRERSVEATRRADEAMEHAIQLEARVRALTDELDARRGFRPPPEGPAGDPHAMERTRIEQALQRVGFNKTKAARELGLTRHQLYVRIRRYGIGG